MNTYVKKAVEYIASMDLSKVERKLIDKDHMSKSKAVNAVKEYRKFLSLAVENPALTLVPTEEVDKAWHHHILDTERYHKDCKALFGNYLHHNPNFFGTEKFYKSFDQTQQLLKTRFKNSASTKTNLISFTKAKAASCGGAPKAASCGGGIRAASCGGGSKAASCGGGIRAASYGGSPRTISLGGTSKAASCGGGVRAASCGGGSKAASCGGSPRKLAA